MTLGFSLGSGLALLGVLTGLGLGLMGLLTPHRALRFVGLKAAAEEGLGEVRATYGGMFIALELVAAALLLGRDDSAGMVVAGAAWLGAALGRVVSLVVDGRRTPKNAAAVLFEAGIGLLHLAAALGP